MTAVAVVDVLRDAATPTPARVAARIAAAPTQIHLDRMLLLSVRMTSPPIPARSALDEVSRVSRHATGTRGSQKGTTGCGLGAAPFCVYFVRLARNSASQASPRRPIQIGVSST